MIRSILLLGLLSFCIQCKTATKIQTVDQDTVAPIAIPTVDKPKNIILMIGDGMGLGQLTAGMYYNGNKTALEKFPVIGLHKSHAGNKLITDSAAAATSFASGVKTYNGAIGVDMDTVAVETVLEKAEKKGLATGLIATSTIVHATPASFISHNKYRKNYEEIALDFMDTEIDFFAGGGKKFFDRREDERDLLKEMESNGYIICNYLTDYDNCPIDPSKNFAYLTADADPLPASQGRDYLEPITKSALPYLDNKNDNGFFLMVEGSQIDWGGHANNSEYILTEFVDFDKTVNHVLEWAKKDGETLVIVTADHETGGYAIQQESTMDSLITAFTSTYHTAVMIPVFAYGPGSATFSGIYENTAIFDKMVRALSLDNSPSTFKK